MNNIVQIKAAPILFDEALCVKPACVIRGLQSAGERKTAINSLPVPAELDSTGGIPAGKRPETRAKAAKRFRAIRSTALTIASAKGTPHAREDAEKYLVKELGAYYGVELKSFGLAAPLCGVDVISYMHTALKSYTVSLLSRYATDGSASPNFIIVGGTLDGVTIELSELVTMKPEEFDGVVIEGLA